MGNVPPPLAPQNPPQFLPPEQNLTFEIVPRHMRMYQLNELEMDSLSSSNNSLSLAFFGATAGAFASFASVVFSGSVPDPKHYAVCLSMTICSGVMAAYFGISAIVQGRKAKKSKQELKERKIVQGP